MARPKKDTEAPQGAAGAVGEGNKAPVAAPEAGEPEGERSAPLPEMADAVEALIVATAPPEVATSVRQVVVVALQPSRWRIGLHFTQAPRSLVEPLSDGDLAALVADPLLSVTIVEDN